METPPRERTQIGWPARWALVVVALGLIGVLGVARWLEPDPRGYGTHTQLGLRPCMFAFVTGQRCPACGMTTAFAWFARGRFDRSWDANPAGSLLAPACVVLVVWLLAGAIRGRPLGFQSFEQPLIGMVVAVVALSLLSWTFRLFFGRAL